MFDIKFHKKVNKAYRKLTTEPKIAYINDSQLRNRNNIIKLDTKKKFIENFCLLNPELEPFTEYFNSFVLYFNLYDSMDSFRYNKSSISNHCFSPY